MDQPWRIEMLGGLAVRQSDTVITRFKTHKNGILLAYLACYIHRTHTREALIDTFWPDVDLEQGRPSLSVALSSLRHQLEPPGTPARSVLVTTNADVKLNPAACTTDVIEFEGLLKSAKNTESASDEISFLTRAAACYKGELLFGYYEDWCLVERERLEDLYVQALRSLVRGLVREREIRRAIPYAEIAVAKAPLQEELCRDLMQVYAAAGQPSLALQKYRELEERLQRDLGERPAATTRNLASDISERVQQDVPSRGVVVPTPTAPAAASPISLAGIQTILAIRFGEITEGRKETFLQAMRVNGGQEGTGRAEYWWAVFGRASDAVACALAVCRDLGNANVETTSETCFALHTCELDSEENRSAAKQHLSAMLSAAHPGQLLCSEETAVFARRSLELGVRMRDLGRWRLRDNESPVLLFEIHRQDEPEGGYPPPKATRAHQLALPIQFTRFFGREQELTRLLDLFSTTQPARLVTLTGPGGVGKTRLAVEVGQRLADSWLGAVCLVPLATVQEPARIVEAILDALKQPRLGADDPLTKLCDSLDGRPTLLILDNLEQIADGAAPIVASMLEKAPLLSCLATSRRLLNIAAEQEMPLPPLPVPGANAEPHSQILFESVRLFLDRAQIARPDFQLTGSNTAVIAELCTKLEGLPLALELAAARAMVLTPSQMLTQLEDRFAFLTSRRRDVSERHRTLRGAVEWSYRLLDPQLQQFFARLSVFRDGWTLEGAEAVCGYPETLDGLCQLQECSLLNTEMPPDASGPRFRMLQSLQTFGDEQLDNSNREALRVRHMIAFASFAEQGASHLQDDSRSEWLEKLEQDHENLRTALNYLLECGRVTEAAGMCVALSEFWERRGWIREGAAFIVRCLTSSKPIQDDVLLRRLLSSAGWFAYLQAHYSDALAWQQRNLAECEQANDSEGECIVLNNLGLIAQAQGEDEEAWLHFEASLALARELGNRARQAARLSNIGLLAIQTNRNPEAQQALEEALSIYRTDGDAYGIAACLCNLGKLAIYERRYAGALALATESMRLFEEARDLSGVAYALANLGLAKTLSADHEGAASVLLRALTICRETGLQSLVPILLETLARNSAAQARYPHAALALAAAERLRTELHTPRSAFETEAVALVKEYLRSTPPTSEQIASQARAEAFTIDQIITEILDPKSGELP